MARSPKPKGARKPARKAPPRERRGKRPAVPLPKLRSVAEPVAAKSEAPAEDPVITAILESLAEAATLSPRDIAVRIAAARAKPGDGLNPWRRYFTAVKQQALHLAREGRIEIVRKGAVVDPAEVKGIVRYRLARGGPAD